MIFRALLLLTILAFAISQDVKGLKAPQAQKGNFIPPSRRTIFGNNEQSKIHPVKGLHQQQQVGDLKHASSEESPLTDDDSSADTYAGDNADNEDGFDDNSDHPVIHNEALLKNGDEQPAPMPMEAPVKSAQQPVQLPQEPQMPVKAPMAPKTWRKPMPMAPTKGQYPMDTKSAQVPQQDEVPYFRRPAVTLLRTPWGFEHSEGLAVVVDGPQYMQGLPQAPVYAPQYHDQQQQQYHDQTQQNHN